jgi:2-polyprenyl-3-methyl-5-hydroxy-6-metoxy-1,4-benzoquinol methylase
MKIKNQNPYDQIKTENPWYIDEQFSKQFYRPGSRAIIENRWNIFRKTLQELSQNKDRVPLNTPIRILDAGCGDGINLIGLHKISQAEKLNAQIYAVDYNPLRLQRASSFSFVEEINQSTLDDLPYVDEWFDVILCNQVLEHIPKDQKVLEELNRVTRTKGILILGVPNEGCCLAWLRNHIVQRSILKNTDHVNFYTENKLSNLLTESGFSILNLEKLGFFLPHSVLHFVLSYTTFGRWCLNTLGKTWKSQCAELISTSIKI